MARVNLAIARAHAHLADYMDLLQQERTDFDSPDGFLGHKMRGLTAEILYFDQFSNTKQQKTAMVKKFLIFTFFIWLTSGPVAISEKNSLVIVVNADID